MNNKLFSYFLLEKRREYEKNIIVANRFLICSPKNRHRDFSRVTGKSTSHLEHRVDKKYSTIDQHLARHFKNNVYNRSTFSAAF